MTRIITIISIIILTLNSIKTYSQINFNIVDTVLNENYRRTIKNLNLGTNNVFFEDSLYTVKKTCFGEWGGSIWFKNKKSGIEYSCTATCPVVVNKIHNKYYVTASLAHLVGFSEIIEINNPDSMEIFKMPEPRYKKGKLRVYDPGDSESKSNKGTKILVDSVGVITMYSFVYKEQLVHILYDYKRTFLSKIEKNKFVTIDTIYNGRLPMSNSEVYNTENSGLIILFNEEKNKGFLEIKDNKITIKRFK